MKKILLGSAILFLFAIAITLFQLSCSKETIAQTSTVSQNDVILYQKAVSTSFGTEWWVCKKDGSNQRKVNFPSAIVVTQLGVSLLSDKNSVVFSASLNTTPLGISEIYTMNIDGTNLQKIVTDGSNNYLPKAYW